MKYKTLIYTPACVPPAGAGMTVLRGRRTVSGFTLIEMSIVLIIIGFIIGGIVMGTTIKRHAKIASAMSDEQKYVAAAIEFQQKYNYLPGDFPNAQAYWGVNPNCASGGAGTGTQTCNGNGDGQVENWTGEMTWFWQHLVNAQMIPGFGGTYVFSNPSNWTEYMQIGINCPPAKVDGSGFSLNFMGLYTSENEYDAWYAANYGHALIFGGQDINDYGYTWMAALTPNEAHGVDLKYDDGMPSTGTILAITPEAYACANDATSPPTYLTGDTLEWNGCSLAFITGF